VRVIVAQAVGDGEAKAGAADEKADACGVISQLHNFHFASAKRRLNLVGACAVGSLPSAAEWTKVKENTMRKLILAVAALVMCGAASAEGVRVRLSNINTPEATPKLYQALEKAARKACRDSAPLYGYNPPSLQRQCVAATMTVTLAKIESPMLLAYAADRGVQMATAKRNSAVATTE
jgi:UrcA family protein